MPVKPVFYIVNNKKGDSLESPNAFLLDYNNDVTLEDVVSAFPLSKYGNYHFRFRIGDRSEVNWVDISNIDDKIPLYYDYIWIDTIGIQTKQTGPSQIEVAVSKKSKEHSHHHSDKKEKSRKSKEEENEKESEKQKQKEKEKEKTMKQTNSKQETPVINISKPYQIPQKVATPNAPRDEQKTKVPTISTQSAPSLTKPEQVKKPIPKPVAVEESSESSEEEIDLFGPSKPVDPCLSTFTGTSYDGKSPAVIKAMKKREKELKKKQEEARIEMERQKKLAKDAAEDKDKAIEVYGNKIKAWAEENGVKRDIRGLLSSMQNVLWEGIEWKPINMGDLLADGKVKLGYYKASRIVHPDKTVDCTPEQKLIAERIFDALNQAWNTFQSKQGSIL